MNEGNINDDDNMYHDTFQGKAKTSSNLAWHRPMSTRFRLEEELIQRTSRALEAETDPLEKLRLMCLSHGAVGIMGLARVFRKMDEGGTGRLTKEKFANCIKETGLDFSYKDAVDVFNKFKRDSNGTISLDEFLLNVRPSMSETRRSILEQAFKKLDKTGDGVLSVEDLRRCYAVTSQQSYMCGEETAEFVMDRFLSNFEQDGIVDGKVTHEEFMNYYSGLSVSIDNDCFFDLMIRQAYKL
ncbi:calcyphosin-like protein [Ostrinia furnacalis]|uniref:calcyphosin-like protein n=1 Tax=Ostrinia furnacalis TaxID=93504 RepID=UPI00103ED488|nr:calcyphosin-like protein [Ostrinia furnacalis]